MITMKELGSINAKQEHLQNLTNLYNAVNLFRNAYGKPLLVTSGYRSIEDHLRIYKAKGITDKNKIPMQSKHLYGLAADFTTINEPIENLHKFVRENIKLLEDIGLWVEDLNHTKTWLHLQVEPPKSGNRFFIP